MWIVENKSQKYIKPYFSQFETSNYIFIGDFDCNLESSRLVHQEQSISRSLKDFSNSNRSLSLNYKVKFIIYSESYKCSRTCP